MIAAKEQRVDMNARSPDMSSCLKREIVDQQGGTENTELAYK